MPLGEAVPPLQEHGLLLSANTIKDITNTTEINREGSTYKIAYQPGNLKCDEQFIHIGNIRSCRNTGGNVRTCPKASSLAISTHTGIITNKTS